MKDPPITLIVVDQHEDVCHRLARSLEALPGVRVLAHTTNVMLAAELAHQYSPDVIVADFNWGAATRPDALRLIGEMSPDSRLVMYSSYYTDGEREAFAEAGADICLLKGMSVKELGAQLRKAAAARRLPA